MSNTQASIERHEYFFDTFHFSYSRFTEAIERERAREEERGEGCRHRAIAVSRLQGIFGRLKFAQVANVTKVEAHPRLLQRPTTHQPGNPTSPTRPNVLDAT